MDLFAYFHDPVLRGPMIGTLFLSLALSLIGVFVFFQRKSLIGEVLSHAAYPGVILGLIALGCTKMQDEVLFFAIFTCLLALFLIHFLSKKISEDLTLTFILSSFFGFGILLLSLLQFSCGYLGRLAETFFFGQAATMDDGEILLYGILAASIVLFMLLFYKELKALLFDPLFAKSIGINSKIFSVLLLSILLITLVLGIRSVGVVLISAILVAPTIAARQFSKRLSHLLLLAPLFGLLSAFFGNILSFEISHTFSEPGNRLVIPTGPAIVIVATLFAILAVLFSPSRGMISIAFRHRKFKNKCIKENILKHLLKQPEKNLGDVFGVSTFRLNSYCRKGWLKKTKDGYTLTDSGKIEAQKIVRYHRLWEAYLVQIVGKGVKDVHAAAEEMEHFLDMEMDEKLTFLLKDPKVDPHQKPIPPKDSK